MIIGDQQLELSGGIKIAVQDKNTIKITGREQDPIEVPLSIN